MRSFFFLCSKPLCQTLLTLLILLAPRLCLGQSPATFTYPSNNDTAVDTTLPFTWNAVANAQSYYVILGTKKDGRDLFQSGEITTTKVYVPALIEGVLLYGRLSTKLNGVWSPTYITFQVANGRAYFVQPLDGTRMFPPYTFQWTATKGVQAYSLKIGTKPGARDLFDGGEVNATSLTPSVSLPFNTQLYARIWTRANSIWVFNDISFMTTNKPLLLYPQDKEPSADVNRSFTWMGFPNATKYYLKIGTTVGANDLYSSGETIQTSANIPPLPAGRTLYGRTLVKFNNLWYSSDTTFQVTNGKATLLNPTDGSTTALSNTTFQWSTMKGATGYVLWVGTSLGAKDVFVSGETKDDNVQPPNLPTETPLYARIYTRHPNGWAFTDSQFTLAPAPVRILNPVPNSYFVIGSDIRWTTSPNIGSYRLLLGSSAGASDYLDTGEVKTGKYPCPILPVGVPIYARVLCNWKGSWYSTDTVFYAHSTFQYPLNGAMDVTRSKTLVWSPGAKLNGVAPRYVLALGTSTTKTDLLPPTNLTTNQYGLQNVTLPDGVPLYATVRTILGDKTSRFATTVFATSNTPANPLTLLYPANGEQKADLSNPFAWQESDLATGYQLQILSNGNVVRDSGVIVIPRYFASDLPTGDYTAVLSAQIGGAWLTTTSSFHASKTGGDINKEIETALWATDRVRKMALAGNRAFQHTQVWTEVLKNLTAFSPVCTHYARALLSLEQQMNIGCVSDDDKQPRTLDIAFIAGNTTHILNEYYHRTLGRWILLDPTFGLAPLRTSDGAYASKEDVQNAVLQQEWGAISYQLLGDYGDSFARGYYVDYPLLYLNLGNPLVPQGKGNNPLPYLVKATLPFTQPQFFLIRSSAKSVTLVLDGVERTIPVLGLDNTSNILRAKSLKNNSTVDATAYFTVRHHF